MFDGFLGRKFTSKCKSLLKITRTRLETVRKKRTAVQRYLKNDIADLLRNGLDYNAYGRAEGLLVEMNITECYNLIEQFCGCISNQISTIDKQRQCPEECKEAVSSLMFAAARFADLPELRDLRNMFSQKYGNSLDSFVNKELVEKLKQNQPTKDMKIHLIQDIAKEFTIEWNSKALEQKLYTPPAPDQNLGTPKGRNEGHHQWNRSKDDDVPIQQNQEAFSKHKNDRYKRQSVKDIEVSVKGEDEVERKTPYSIVPPPYVIQEKAGSCILERKQTGLASKVEEPVRQTKSNSDGVDSPKLGDDDNTIAGTNAKPRSVRRRPLKPPPGHDNARITSPSATRPPQEGSRQNLGKFDDDDADEQENEERKLDEILDQYSLKWSPNVPGKGKVLKPSTLQQAAPDASGSARNRLADHPCRKSDSVLAHPPVKTASLPPEPTTSHVPRGHARAASLQPDMLTQGGHVHPKLPDYDDLAARLAALRGM